MALLGSGPAPPVRTHLPPQPTASRQVSLPAPVTQSPDLPPASPRPGALPGVRRGCHPGLCRGRASSESQGQVRASWAQPGWNRPSRHLLTLWATGRSPPVLTSALSVKTGPQRQGREVWPLKDRPAAPAGPRRPSPAAGRQEGCVKGRGPLGGGHLGWPGDPPLGTTEISDAGAPGCWGSPRPPPRSPATPPHPCPCPPPPAGSAFPSLGCLCGAVCQHVDPAWGGRRPRHRHRQAGRRQAARAWPSRGTRAQDLGPDARTRSP